MKALSRWIRGGQQQVPVVGSPEGRGGELVPVDHPLEVDATPNQARASEPVLETMPDLPPHVAEFLAVCPEGALRNFLLRGEFPQTTASMRLLALEGYQLVSGLRFQPQMNLKTKRLISQTTRLLNRLAVLVPIIASLEIEVEAQLGSAVCESEQEDSGYDDFHCNYRGSGSNTGPIHFGFVAAFSHQREILAEIDRNTGEILDVFRLADEICKQLNIDWRGSEWTRR